MVLVSAAEAVGGWCMPHKHKQRALIIRLMPDVTCNSIYGTYRI